jgi:hypothetical protein
MEREDPTRPHEELHSELDADAQDLEQRAEEVGERIDDARTDWERKKEDSTVPGAQADDDQPPAAGESPAAGPGGPA